MFTASPTLVLYPWPPYGGLTCALSPARNTRREANLSATSTRAVHGSEASSSCSARVPMRPQISSAACAAP
jgi:hypothetical protein